MTTRQREVLLISLHAFRMAMTCTIGAYRGQRMGRGLERSGPHRWTEGQDACAPGLGMRMPRSGTGLPTRCARIVRRLEQSPIPRLPGVATAGRAAAGEAHITYVVVPEG